MGLSETILAAMIGAVATVSGALFQLFMAWRSRKVDSRPKKGTTARSLLSILALMVASAAGGFLYSEFLKQRNAEDLRAMRDELKDMRALIAQGRDQVHGTDLPPSQPAGTVTAGAVGGGGAVARCGAGREGRGRWRGDGRVDSLRAGLPPDGYRDGVRRGRCTAHRSVR